MPKYKSRRGEANGDWDADGTQEGYVNGSDGNSNNNRASVGGVDEHGGDIDKDGISNKLGGGRPRQTRGGGSSQPRPKHDLGQWTEAVTDTVQSMGAAHQAIRDLQSRFESHMDDLRTMEETKDSLKKLKADCNEKDAEMSRQMDTITTLSSMNRKTEEKIKRQKEDIEQEKQELKDEKAKLEKRVTTAMAEERHKLDIEIDKLATKNSQSYDKRRKELEDEFTTQREENNRRVTALETENRQLSTTVEEQKKKVEDLTKKLERTAEQCDVLERAKDSIKREKKGWEMELKTMKKELALSPKSTEYFKQRFAEICGLIEDISFKYFSDIDGKDLEKVHEELAAADPCFASVPIEDTDDSRNLRIAHAQRIISDVICEFIWKPFRSEFTLLHPEFNDLLANISEELEKSGQCSHAANVWTALTTRALQSLPAGPVLSRAPESREPLRPASSGRPEGVVAKVLSVLSPLVSLSHREDLRTDLLRLTTLAIDIWNDAQTGELRIVVTPKLDHTHIEEWRSQKFDPASTSRDDESESDIMFKTRPRIFTLFPQIIAREAVGPVKHDAGPPGSWPPDQGHGTVETYIHPGIGLPEWSSLVVRGKEEQEQRNEYLSKALENAKKELHSSRRLTGQGRRDSMASLTSAPSSPSQQWKMGGTMKYPDK